MFASNALSVGSAVASQAPRDLALVLIMHRNHFAALKFADDDTYAYQKQAFAVAHSFGCTLIDANFTLGLFGQNPAQTAFDLGHLRGKAGAHRYILRGIYDHIGARALRNHHSGARTGGQFSRLEFGGHAPCAQSSPSAASQCFDLICDLRHFFDQLRVGIFAGVSGEQAALISKDHQ